MKKILLVAFGMVTLAFVNCGVQTTGDVVSDTIDTVIVDTVDSITADTLQ